MFLGGCTSSKGFEFKRGEDNSYVATTGYTRADLEALCEGTGCDVEDLFDHLDWMSPETLADEWIQDEEEQEALKEGN